VTVEAWSARLPPSQAQPSRPGPGREGRSSSGALHLHGLALARSPEGGTTADGKTRQGEPCREARRTARSEARRRAISVPLGVVIRGQSRSLADHGVRWSEGGSGVISADLQARCQGFESPRLHPAESPGQSLMLRLGFDRLRGLAGVCARCMPDRVRRAVIALGSFGACGVGAGRRAVARRRLCDHLAVSYDLPYGRANALKATSRPSESIRPCTTSTSPVASTSRRRL